MSSMRFQGFGVTSYRVHDGKTLDTIESLQQWEILGGQCAKCGRVAWLEKRSVAKTLGNQYLLNLRGRLKCECGNRRGNDVLIGYLDRNL